MTQIWCIPFRLTRSMEWTTLISYHDSLLTYVTVAVLLFITGFVDLFLFISDIKRRELLYTSSLSILFDFFFKMLIIFFNFLKSFSCHLPHNPQQRTRNPHNQYTHNCQHFLQLLPPDLPPDAVVSAGLRSAGGSMPTV